MSHRRCWLGWSGLIRGRAEADLASLLRLSPFKKRLPCRCLAAVVVNPLGDNHVATGAGGGQVVTGGGTEYVGRHCHPYHRVQPLSCQVTTGIPRCFGPCLIWCVISCPQKGGPPSRWRALAPPAPRRQPAASGGAPGGSNARRSTFTPPPWRRNLSPAATTRGGGASAGAGASLSMT